MSGDEENKAASGADGHPVVASTSGFKPITPKPRVPNPPTPEQFRKARKIARRGQGEWSREDVAKVSRELRLPVDANAIAMVEEGKESQKPTQSNSKNNIDYRDEHGISADMPYPQRLHLVYLSLGCIFPPDGKDPVWVDPLDLWGAFSQLPSAWKAPSTSPKDPRVTKFTRCLDGRDVGQTEAAPIDIVREIIDCAFKRAQR